MDDKTKKSFIKLLKEIISGDLSNIYKWYGICGNLSNTGNLGDVLSTLGYDFVENNPSCYPLDT